MMMTSIHHQEQVISVLYDKLELAIRFANENPNSPLAKMKQQILSTQKLIEPVLTSSSGAISATSSSSSFMSCSTAPMSGSSTASAAADASSSSSSSIKLEKVKEEELEQEQAQEPTIESSPTTANSSSSRSIEDIMENSFDASVVIKDEDANQIMHNFLLSVSRNCKVDQESTATKKRKNRPWQSTEGLDDSLQLHNESSESAIDFDYGAGETSAPKKKRKASTKSKANSKPATADSLIASNSNIPLIHVAGKAYLTHKDLTTITKTKYPLNEALVKNFKKEREEEAFIWVGIADYDMLVVQHPKIKKNHFQGTNKSMRLFSTDFMVYLKNR